MSTVFFKNSIAILHIFNIILNFVFLCLLSTDIHDRKITLGIGFSGRFFSFFTSALLYLRNLIRLARARPTKWTTRRKSEDLSSTLCRTTAYQNPFTYSIPGSSILKNFEFLFLCKSDSHKRMVLVFESDA